MSISLKELLDGNIITDLSIAQQHNLEELLIKINKIRTTWGKPMIVTSGVRQLQDHLRIYSQLAAQKGVPFNRDKVPMGSWHLKAGAVDISDPDGSLHDWCKKNIKILEDVGLWCEEKDEQRRVHFQIRPPASGKRFFYP